MNKSIVCAAILVASLAAPAWATPINLAPFNTDFQTLMNGIARDVAPSLRLGALSADIQGDATIDQFSVNPLGVGLTASRGIARVLKPDSGVQWGFVLPLANLVSQNISAENRFFEDLMLYPSMKMGFGLALPGLWDLSVNGIWWPQGLVGAAKGLATGSIKERVDKLDPQFSFANLGIQVRKTFIQDSGPMSFVPALSVGGGYHYTNFNLGVTLQGLSSLGVTAPSVGTNQTLDMTGTFGVKSSAQVVTLDLHVSKHLLFFTPFAKLSGAYQSSFFSGTADLDATVTDTTIPSNPDVTHQQVKALPTVSLSDFSFLTTTGLELNVFMVIFHFSMTADVGQAFLNVSDWSLKGIDADAFSLNTGLRVAF